MNEDAKNLLVNLNNTLTKYIEVHDAVFTQRLGQVLDYSTLVDKLNTVSNELKDNKCIEIPDSNIREAVHAYVNALLETVTQLMQIITNLKSKAEGEKYGFFAYRKDIKCYKELERNHLELGRALNSFV